MSALARASIPELGLIVAYAGAVVLWRSAENRMAVQEAHASETADTAAAMARGGSEE